MLWLLLLAVAFVVLLAAAAWLLRAKEFHRPPRVGIVSMVTAQPDFQHWLAHHLGMVERIYLRIENSPEIEQLAAGDSRIYFEAASVDQQPRDNYFEQMDRQRLFVERMMDKARGDGLDVLFHIDADELIAVTSGKLAEQLLQVPKGTANIHLHNVEAQFDRNERCFQAAGFLDCRRGRCTSYANGKSAAVLKYSPRFLGPHEFDGKRWQMPFNRAVIQHFDSCTYALWKAKFQRQANSSRLQEIPFDFYRKSIDKLQSGCSEAELIKFYRASKWR